MTGVLGPTRLDSARGPGLETSCSHSAVSRPGAASLLGGPLSQAPAPVSGGNLMQATAAGTGWPLARAPGSATVLRPSVT